MNDADAIAQVAELCATARSKLPKGHHRLCILLDMILIDLARNGVVPEESRGGEPDLHQAPEGEPDQF